MRNNKRSMNSISGAITCKVAMDGTEAKNENVEGTEKCNLPGIIGW